MSMWPHHESSRMRVARIVEDGMAWLLRMLDCRGCVEPFGTSMSVAAFSSWHDSVGRVVCAGDPPSTENSVMV